MKSIFLSLLVLGVVISATGCEKESTSVTDGVTQSEVEKYNQMVEESNASMAAGDEAMKKDAGN